MRVVSAASGRLGFDPRSSHTKDLKTVLDIALLNSQHNKVRIKRKLEQSREWSRTLPLHPLTSIDQQGSASIRASTSHPLILTIISPLGHLTLYQVPSSWKQRQIYLPLHLGVAAIEKGAFGTPSIKFANLHSILNLYNYMKYLVCQPV